MSVSFLLLSLEVLLCVLVFSVHKSRTNYKYYTIVLYSTYHICYKFFNWLPIKSRLLFYGSSTSGQYHVCLFDLIPFKKFSGMSRWRDVEWIKYLADGHNAVPLM